MTISIILSIILGIFFGVLILPENIIIYLDQGVTWGLCLMLFFVGMDIGKTKEIFQKIKILGWRILLIPLSISLGSIVGAGTISFAMDMSIWEASAVGAGMGWYSLSAVILTQLHSTELGAIAFLSNVIREVLAIILLPFIAKNAKHIYTIAPAGATSMDTTLPIISKYTSPEVAVLAFISGMLLSFIIPFAVPFLIQFAL